MSDRAVRISTDQPGQFRCPTIDEWRIIHDALDCLDDPTGDEMPPTSLLNLGDDRLVHAIEFPNGSRQVYLLDVISWRAYCILIDRPTEQHRKFLTEPVGQYLEGPYEQELWEKINRSRLLSELDLLD